MDATMDDIRQYFRRRLIGLAYCHRIGSGKPQFELASGFLLDVDFGLSIDFGVVIVTAGHFIQDILRRRTENSLEMVALMFPSGPRTYEIYEVPVDHIDAFGYFPTEELDIGLIPVNQEILKLADIGGLKVINKKQSEPSAIRQSVRQRLLFGLLAEGSRTLDVELFTYFDQGKEVACVETQLGAICVGMLNLQAKADEADVVITNHPISDDFGSVSGMSGGLVVDIYPGMPVDEYQWIGVQSSQTTTSWNGATRLKSIKYVNANVVVNAIKSEFEKCANRLNDSLVIDKE